MIINGQPTSYRLLGVLQELCNSKKEQQELANQYNTAKEAWAKIVVSQNEVEYEMLYFIGDRLAEYIADTNINKLIVF